MILLTVGTQMPFDRFVRMVDAIAPALPEPVVAQIGNGRYEPVNMEWHRLVPAVEFEVLVRQCSRIVSHAGIGTIVTAGKHGKPLIMVPRLASAEEHRNDHQLATVRALEGRAGVYVARDETELAHLLTSPLKPPTREGAKPERDRLRNTISSFLGEARNQRTPKPRRSD